jgi:SOS-response transcriptional repressor LexA
MQYTLRNIPPQIDQALRRRALSERKSLNQVTIEALMLVDPDVVADNGKFVVVRLDDTQEATFKQLIIEGDRMYLKALNPDWPTRIMEVTENAYISGILVV